MSAFAVVRPFVFTVVAPLLQKLSPTWIFIQTGLRARQLRAHAAAMARLNKMGGKAARAARAGAKVKR